jgi:hypothetical protein
MKQLFDLSKILQTLHYGIRQGYWTIEDLDTPPPGYIGSKDNYRNLLRSSNPTDQPIRPEDF